MKLIKILILLSLTISLGFSQEQFERILITKTSKKSGLSKIKKVLDSINIKMYVQSLPSGYYIYSSKFINSKNANNALKRVKRKFSHAKIVIIDIPKKVQDIDKKNSKAIAIQKPANNKTDIYINLTFGYSNISGTTNDVTASTLSNTAMSYSIEGGYILNNNWSASGAYLNTSTNDISSHDFYAEINYRHHLDDKISIGGGLLAGFSSLEIVSFAISTASMNILYGYDLALDYKLDESFNLFTKYQGLYKDHVINIDSTSKISFDYTHYILAGVGYRF